jgi:hypothetical protein
MPNENFDKNLLKKFEKKLRKMTQSTTTALSDVSKRRCMQRLYTNSTMRCNRIRHALPETLFRHSQKQGTPIILNKIFPKNINFAAIFN